MVESTKKAFSKLILLGDINVGKTSLISSFVNDGRPGTQQVKATVGTDFVKKDVRVNATQVTM